MVVSHVNECISMTSDFRCMCTRSLSACVPNEDNEGGGKGEISGGTLILISPQFSVLNIGLLLNAQPSASFLFRASEQSILAMQICIEKVENIPINSANNMKL